MLKYQDSFKLTVIFLSSIVLKKTSPRKRFSLFFPHILYFSNGKQIDTGFAWPSEELKLPVKSFHLRKGDELENPDCRNVHSILQSCSHVSQWSQIQDFIRIESQMHQIVCSLKDYLLLDKSRMLDCLTSKPKE